MQTCWNCGAQQFDGTIFCLECGANLVGKNPRRETTASLGQSAAGNVSDYQPEPVPPHVIPEPAARQPSQEFCLIVLNSGERIPLEADKELLIGRSDKARGIMPDIDLGLYGGYDAGVSRRHANIALQDGDCVLQDLGSANGTFVNGRRMAPNQPTALNQGDEIKFGTLLMRIEF